MLEELFLQIVNKSFVAGIVILIILVARVPLKKAPRKFAYLLWAVALFRLAVPFSFESALSLLPVNPAPVSGAVLKASVPRIQTGMAAVDHSVNGLLPQAEAAASVNPLQVWAFIGSVVWLLGMAALLIHGTVSLVRMKKSLEAASWEKDNIYHSETVETPFVLGLIRPKIYLPASLSESERAYIVLHEQTHIKRFDHVVRFVSYLAVCVHWFNPLAWLAFHLSGRDMEMSCDEAVLGQLGHGVKQAYSQSLLNLATGRRRFALTPLAFGEGDTKGRITNVLNLKKPLVWVMAVAFTGVVLLAAGLLANPELISLPDPDSVRSVELEQVNEGSSLGFVTIKSEEGIEAVVTSLEGARKTLKASVNDAPPQSNHLILRLNREEGQRILFIYSERGNYYIDEPYLGVYKSDRLRSVELYRLYTEAFEEPGGNGAGNNSSASGTEIKRIVDEKLDRIMSSPRESSNTHDYIEAHYEDYRDIVALGEEALDYLLETVESGNETGLRGAIMRELIREFQDRQIGYISGFGASGTPRVTFDPVEWITLEDADRIEALGIEDVEMPNGYYIHNPEIEALEYEVSEAAEYRFINWGNAFGGGEQDGFHYSTTDRKEFDEYLDIYSDRAVTVPFWITVREGVVQGIEEQYVP